MSPQAFLTTRLLSNGAKLALFGEPLVDADDSPIGEESVAAFVRRRFNQEILDYIANPFVGGIFAGDPEQLSVRHALPKLYGLERTHGSVVKAFGSMMRVRKRDAEAGAAALAGGIVSFRNGLQELPDALARELHAEIRLRAPVTQLRAGPKGWTVGAEWNPESEYRFFWYPSPPTRCRFLWQQAVVNNDGGVAPCCGTFFREDDVGHLAVHPGDLGAASFREIWNGPKFQAARGFYRARTGTDETRQLICFDCPLTKVWEKWQRHQEAGGTLAGFDPGYSTNECFNYFWNRRPARAVSGAAPAS